MGMATAMRVEAARDLLLASDLPLRAIAARVGFSDETSLSHAIRQRTASPSGALRRLGGTPSGSGQVRIPPSLPAP